MAEVVCLGVTNLVNQREMARRAKKSLGQKDFAYRRGKADSDDEQ